MTRTAFHLSLRHDDEYEYDVGQSLQDMPRGYAKLALVGMIREFIPRGSSREEIFATLMDFANDTHAARLIRKPKLLPRSAMGAHEQRPVAKKGSIPRPPLRQAKTVSSDNHAVRQEPDSLEFDFTPANTEARAAV